VLIVAGWRDGYRTAALRMGRRLDAPWELLAGPWCHKLPDRGVPGPRYPFLAEMARFFHRHLDDEPDDGPTRPRSVFWLGGPDSPAHPHEIVSGGWHASELWPQEGEPVMLELGGPAVAPASVTAGIMTGQWCPPPPASGQFLDQRRDDALSATFDSERLEAPLAFFGDPVVSFSLRHPGPRAIVSVKLQNVAPDGSSQHVTGAAINIAVDGEQDIELPLMANAWRFPAGHHLRIAIAASDWPNLWPLPELAPLEITSAVRLTLPGLPPDATRFSPPDGRLVDIAQPGAETDGESHWHLITELETGRAGIAVATRSEDHVPAEGWSISESQERRATAIDDDPLSAEAWGAWHYRLIRPGLDTEIHAEATFRGTAEEFLVDLELVVEAGGAPFAERRWSERIPRNGV
jgi:predicted acyl esterase